MKYLFLFALFVIAFTLVYRRVRPYLVAARRFLALFRDARSIAPNDPATPNLRRPTRAGEKLARCSTCGTWLPAARALALRNSPDLYCSHACLERAASAEPAKRRTGRR